MTALGSEDLQLFLGLLLFFGLIAYAIFRRGEREHRWRPKLQSGSTLNIPPGHYFTARVARVIDGDTVDVTTKGRRIRIRLDSIDCPEDGQDWGDVATHGLIKLIGGKSVSLQYHGLDHHGRTLATIYLSQDRGAQMVNVNERMVALGHAWVMRQFYNHLPRDRQVSLNRIEAWARSKKVGLWRVANPTPPWKWRQSNRIDFC
jgi:endonuclease YncB( thermonuclease family)